MTSNFGTIYVIPGGPGLNSGYMSAFTAALSTSLPNFSVRLLPIERFWKTHPLTFDLLVEALFDIIRGDTSSTRIGIIGHSFGGKLALQLTEKLERAKLAPCFTGVLNLPIHGPSKALTNALEHEKIDFDGIKSENEFRLQWQRSLPYYFGRSPTPDEERVLISESSWMNGEASDSSSPSCVSLLKRTSPSSLRSLFFFLCEGDLVQGEGDADFLASNFPSVTSISEKNPNHFEVLSNPVSLVSKILPRILALCNEP